MVSETIINILKGRIDKNVVIINDNDIMNIKRISYDSDLESFILEV